MADDVLAVVDHLGATPPLYGVGHSMGGAALVMTEQRRPGTWAGLWLYEPILFPSVEGGPRPQGNPMATAARRRRAVFPDRKAARDNYATKPPLDVLHPNALDAYVTYGFRDREDGSVELKCSPETEARTFEGAFGQDIFARLSEVRCPTTIAAGGAYSPPATVAPLTVEALPDGQFEMMAELTHFGPMEDPAAVAARIEPMLAVYL
jgi:pimeloyl-ACP methyl ester carboxylesterase